jgi:hypothetical protein
VCLVRCIHSSLPLHVILCESVAGLERRCKRKDLMGRIKKSIPPNHVAVAVFHLCALA